MSRKTLLLALCCSACTDMPLAPALLPHVEPRVSAINRSQSFSADMPYTVDVLLADYAVKRPSVIAFDKMPLCEAAQLVIASQIGIPVTCSGSGVLSFVSFSNDPAEVLSLFSLGVSSLGGSVVRGPQGLIVQNTSGHRGAVDVYQMDDPSKNFASDDTVNVNQNGFSVVSAPETFFDTARATILSGGRKKVRYFSNGQDASSLLELAAGLGINVTALDHNGGVFVLGDGIDLTLLSRTHALGDRFSTSVPHFGLSSDHLEAMQSVYPSLALASDPTSNVIRVSGDRTDVQAFVRDIRDTTAIVRNVVLHAGFLTVTNQQIESVVNEISGAVSGSLVSVNLGSSSGLSVLLDNSRSSVARSENYSTKMTVRTGSTGRYNSGERVPVVTEIDEEGRQAFEYQDTGLIFVASPVVDGNGVLNLSFQVSVSSSTGVTGVGDNPTIRQSQLTSSIDVNKGDLIVVGGLDNDLNGGTRSAKFGLLRGSGKNRTNSQTLFTIKVVDVY